MKMLERHAMLAALMQELASRDSWCGETYIQKATYLAQELLGVPFGYAFRLYKHGPYSFEVRDELSAMRADDIVAIQPQSYPYGPKLQPTSLGERVLRTHSSLVEQHRPALRFVAESFGAKGVAELERLSTAYLVTRETASVNSREERAKRLRTLKPHITMPDAVAAMRDVDGLIEQANKLKREQ